jgi:hypothetical protein
MQVVIRRRYFDENLTLLSEEITRQGMEFRIVSKKDRDDGG